VDSIALSGAGTGVLVAMTLAPPAGSQYWKEASTAEVPSLTFSVASVTDAIGAVELLSRDGAPAMAHSLTSWDPRDWYCQLALCIPWRIEKGGESTPPWVNVVEPRNPCLRAVPPDVPVLLGADCSTEGDFALAFSRNGEFEVRYGSVVESNPSWAVLIPYPITKGTARDASVLRIQCARRYSSADGCYFGSRLSDEELAAIRASWDPVTRSLADRTQTDGGKVFLTAEGPAFYNWPRDLLCLVQGSRICLVRDLSKAIRDSLKQVGYADARQFSINEVCLDYWNGRFYAGALRAREEREMFVVSFQVTKRGRLLDSRVDCRISAECREFEWECARMEVIGGKDVVFCDRWGSIATAKLPVRSRTPRA
jgi:hypothetical protein